MTGKFAAILMAMALAPTWAQAGGAAPLPLIEKGGSAAMQEPAAPQQVELKGGASLVDRQSILIRRYGAIIERRPVGAGGLTAWTVEKGGRRVVLYTTADGAAVISGIVWDSLTGRNLSDQFLPSLPNVKPPLGGSTAPLPQDAQPAVQSGALVGKYSGDIPESIKTIDTLSGIKEGRGGPADTLYIIFDPRCPYCRKAYSQTREYVKKGFTIKWIPTAALGNPAQGNPLAATILQAKQDQQAEVLRRVLGNKEEIPTQPSKATLDALDRSLNFLFAAFQNNNVPQPQAGVPAAFFLDKHTGKPRMMTGISEQPVIETVFGKL
jgi:thiol:disulfide interchange protein DsbG